MASDREFMTYVVEQMRQAGPIAYRKMFGEYAIYCADKVVALVCDNQLYVKPTTGGRALLGTPREGRPFPGARPFFLIDDGLDDAETLAALIAVTARELPPPKPKAAKPKAAKAKTTKRKATKSRRSRA
jgi:TfoX/Sxy family transcriptional regulator of competence genes